MWGEHFPGVATPWDHPYVTSQMSPAPPKQRKHDKAGASNYEALHFPQYRAERFLNDYVSVYILFYKLSQHEKNK